MSNWKVTLTSPDGEEVVVHPERDATHGIYLAEGQVKGDIIDTPVKTEWDSLALQEGGTQRSVDYEYRDINLGFHVTDNELSAEEADSLLRRMFAYEEDEWDPDDNLQTRLTIETELSGERHLDLLLGNTPETAFDRDPMMDQYFNPQLTLRAGQPMWYTLHRHPLTGAVVPFKVTAYDFTAGDHSNGGVWVENPTDRAMRHTWIVAAGVGTKVWLPDVSWVGKKGAREIAGPYPDRSVQLPTIVSEHEGGFRVTLERGKLMIRDFGNTNVLGQMPVPGSYFMFRIPPYTRKTFLPITIEDCPAGGGRIELWAPQLWSRPYGLEMW